MTRLAHTLGLRAHAAAGPRGPRLFLPLPRAIARAVRAAIEAAAAHRVEHPLAAVGLADVRALVLEAGRARLTYVLGAHRAALRRVAVVEGEAADARALTAELARTIGVDLLAEADADALAAHAAALAWTRQHPAAGARAWLDGERWPPAHARAEGPAIGAVEAVDGEREVALPGIRRALYTTLGAPEAARAVADRGLIARRWLALEGHALEGLSPEADLDGGGAAFTFSRVLGARSRPLPAVHDYAALWAPRTLAAAERWVLEHDRFGAEVALVDALDESTLAAQIAADRLPIDHEVLHFDRLPRRWLRAIVCRDARARDALGAVDVPVLVSAELPGADAVPA